MSEALKSSLGSLYIQFTPGQKPEYFGCADLDAIEEPGGDQTLVQCHDGNGGFKTVGSTGAPPDAVTTSITALTFPDQDVLDELSKCPITLYAMQRDCGRAGIFSNYVRGHIVHHAKVTTRTDENVVMRVDDTETTRKFDLSGWNPVYRFKKLVAALQDIAETADLHTISFCNSEECAGGCGANKTICTDGFIGADSTVGSPSALADVWDTGDGGSNWANVVGHPFDAAVAITASSCFAIDRSTTRWLVAAEGQVGVPLHVSYSDDGGTTWTQVHVGSTNQEGVETGEGMFALDMEHVWLVTDANHVYFSDDGGVTWTLQYTGTGDLNGVHFSDENNGYVVGDAGQIYKTTDGGVSWSAVTDPTGGANINTVYVFSSYRAIIGTAGGEVWQTWNGGTSFTEETHFTDTGTGSIADIVFVNDYCGVMLHNTAAPVGSVYITHDGGYNWEKLTTPSNAGLNQAYMCGCNLAYAVGNASGGTGIVVKVS